MLEMSLHAERGPMVIEDLRELPHSPLVVAEGSALPAFAVSRRVAERFQAVWLIPTEDFQRAMLVERETPAGPLALYLQLRETIADEAAEHSVPTLTVDGSLGIAEMVVAVEGLVAGALAEGPRAETLAERQALLRQANESIASQVRDYYARPWAEGEAEQVVREFICECGDQGCDASVLLPVGALSIAPVLAPNH